MEAALVMLPFPPALLLSFLPSPPPPPPPPLPSPHDTFPPSCHIDIAVVRTIGIHGSKQGGR